MSNIDGGSSGRIPSFKVKPGTLKSSSDSGRVFKDQAFRSEQSRSQSPSATPPSALEVASKEQNHTASMDHLGDKVSASGEFLRKQSFGSQTNQPLVITPRENGPVSNNTIPLNAKPTFRAENKPGVAVLADKARFVTINLFSGMAQKLLGSVRATFLNLRATFLNLKEHHTAYLKWFMVISGKVGDRFLAPISDVYLVGASVEEAGNVGAKVNTFLSSIASSVEDVASKAKISLNEASAAKLAQEMAPGVSVSLKDSFTGLASKVVTFAPAGSREGPVKLAVETFSLLNLRSTLSNFLSMILGAQTQAGEIEAKRRASLEDEEAAMSRLHIDEVTQAAKVSGKPGYTGSERREHHQAVRHQDEDDEEE